MIIDPKKGDQILWLNESEMYPNANILAEEYLTRGQVYTVEHHFMGDPIHQVELQEVDDLLFPTDLFENVNFQFDLGGL